MSAHTPGPWKTSKDALGHNVLGKVGGEWITVADQLDEEDARLIAAAPEMLEALEAIMPYATSGNAANMLAARDMARAAIAKAKGESK